MKSREKIYKRIVEEQLIWYDTMHPADESVIFKANIMAVQNTERIYQMQFTKKRDRKKIIELIGNGQNIHGLCSLMNMEKDEILKLIDKGK